MISRLSLLLSPLPTEAFFESFRKREHLYIKRNTEGFYDSIVSLEDLDACLQSELLPSTFLNVVGSGSRLPFEEWTRPRSMGKGLTASGQLPVVVGVPEQLLKHYTEGATLILNSSDQMIPRLLRTCRELTRELGYPLQANIYITPPGTQGFVKHRDGHDVIVLQIWGRKTWLLYPERATEGLELVFEPGDLLYIPGGLAHEARCSDRGSVHVTLGLTPIYGFKLVEELAQAALSNPLFQEPVPAAFSTDREKQAFNNDFAVRLQALLAEMPASRLLEKCDREFVEKQRTGWSGRFADTLHLPEITGDTILCARAGIVRRLEDRGNCIEVRFARERTAVPKFLRSCLERVLDDTPFTIREIPGLMTDAGKVEFVRPFVANGLLSIVRI